MKIRSRLFHSLIGAGLIAGLALSPALADQLRLRAEAVIDGDTVRLGHLIEGLEKGADIAVFRAPAPGARGTIRADRVISAAREMGIDGIDADGLKVISITRPGRTISRNDLQALIGRAFAERGAKGDLDVILDDHHAARTVDIARTDALKVTNLARDTASGRFEVKVALAGATTGETWTLTGSIVETRDVVVPVSDLERGDALQAKDLTIIKRPANTVGTDVVTAMNDLIGMIPRRVLKSGEPVRQTDIAKPILVEKNQLVSVVYASKGLSLTMRGRAQANGAMGETIRIQNPQSKRFVEGMVTGPAQITIFAAPAPAATLADATTPPRR
ncbi:MAG: flagella basal body P-ring formation protein [Beijerinckiaceae bacterium]|nr:MAG: flagella basal body P-ring formation protein [Beijerinckiaceae bacterium]